MGIAGKGRDTHRISGRTSGRYFHALHITTGYNEYVRSGQKNTMEVNNCVNNYNLMAHEMLIAKGEESAKKVS